MIWVGGNVDDRDTTIGGVVPGGGGTGTGGPVTTVDIKSRPSSDSRAKRVLPRRREEAVREVVCGNRPLFLLKLNIGRHLSFDVRNPSTLGFEEPGESHICPPLICLLPMREKKERRRLHRRGGFLEKFQ
jgi:hypothetical protein